MGCLTSHQMKLLGKFQNWIWTQSMNFYIFYNFYKSYTKEENKDSCPLNIKRHRNNFESFLKCLMQIYKKQLTKTFQL